MSILNAILSFYSSAFSDSMKKKRELICPDSINFAQELDDEVFVHAHINLTMLYDLKSELIVETIECMESDSYESIHVFSLATIQA